MAANHFNYEIFTLYLAIGAVSKLLLIREVSQVEKVWTVVGLLTAATAFGFIMPPEWNGTLIAGILLHYGSELGGRFMAHLTQVYRVNREMKSWREYQKRTAAPSVT